jgi:single-strand DNA-binding protein
MRSINKVIIIGNVTRDPEVKQTVSGQPIATFGVATNRDWITRNGEKHTSSEFHEVVAWSKLADICNKYIRKGKLIYIEGYLKTRSWDTPDGTRKFRTEIVINDLIMLDKRVPGETEDLGTMENDQMPMEEMPEEAIPVEETQL